MPGCHSIVFFLSQCFLILRKQSPHAITGEQHFQDVATWTQISNTIWSCSFFFYLFVCFSMVWRSNLIFIFNSLNNMLQEEMEQIAAKIIFSVSYQIHIHVSCRSVIWQDLSYGKLTMSSKGWYFLLISAIPSFQTHAQHRDFRPESTITFIFLIVQLQISLLLRAVCF